MTPKQYLEAVLRTDLKPFGPYERAYEPISARLLHNVELVRLLHASIGMSGETGEIADIVKKSMMYGKKIDVQHLKEECGDVLWYMAIMLQELGSSFEEVMQMNVDKLAKRYPDGFTEKAALDRADKK